MLRREKGSDSITYHCNCAPDQGRVVLFYIYFNLTNVIEFHEQQQTLLKDLNLLGKLKISQEGLNITLAGSQLNVNSYISWICNYLVDNKIFPVAPDLKLLLTSIEEKEVVDESEINKNSLNILDCLVENDKYKLSDDIRFWTPLKKAFFKPSDGCEHVFDKLSIKIVDEICPFQVENKDFKLDLEWKNDLEKERIERIKLKPREFHFLIKEKKDDGLILDVRNYYESEIGKFDEALCPPIRNFKALPQYLKSIKFKPNNKHLFTYCTGGIRCEKASAYIKDYLNETSSTNEIEKLYMLEGGIHNYLEWFQKSELPKEECLFQGKNYVFDARQSMGLDDTNLISKCGHCDQLTANLFKCKSTCCHKIIIRCEVACFEQLPFCCGNCNNIDQELETRSKGGNSKKRALCQCELDRIQSFKL
ncbi:hypothetical protein K502DRAFT_325246 [Neoconidiobolus thromboides FSU 785]|nr:hypothetical protein K502DRAFT_325246 [Neoconidiobolus thromboides FSU 785]